MNVTAILAQLRSPAGARKHVCAFMRLVLTRQSVSACLLLVTTVCRAQVADSAQDSGKQGSEKQEVGRRLIRKSAGESGEDVMGAIIRLMDQTTRRLEIEMDAGAQTQALQEDVLKQIDDAIKLAAAQTRKSTTKKSTSKSDRRRRESQGKAGQKNARSRAEEGESQPKGAATKQGGQQGDSGATEDRDLTESRRGWGNLPERDRDEVIQGAEEQYLDRYRHWIEQYYRALQDSPEK